MLSTNSAIGAAKAPQFLQRRDEPRNGAIRLLQALEPPGPLLQGPKGGTWRRDGTGELRHYQLGDGKKIRIST